MNSLNARTYYLFKKYYNKTAGSAEIQELFELLRETSDEELVLLMRQEWDNLNTGDTLFDSGKSREMLNKILPERYNADSKYTTNRIRFGWLGNIGKWSVAAALLVFISVGMYFYRSTTSYSVLQVARIPVLNDVPPGGNKAVLTLTDGKRIVLDSLQNGVIVKTSDFQIDKTQDGQLVYHAFNRNSENTLNADLNIVSTPRGGEYRVILPDGSKVWLNTASSIKFPAVFRGKTRDVELKGEAYFEVAKNALMPFRVKSKHAEIEVLGTHFNVRSYNDERSMKTTLVEGSVKVRSGNSHNILKPGEQAVLQGNVIQVIHDTDVEEQIAWKNGLFQFKEAGLADVMKQAAMWYDLEVSYKGRIPKKYITGKISRKVNASEFLNMLSYIGVEFTREGKKVSIAN